MPREYYTLLRDAREKLKLETVFILCKYFCVMFDVTISLFNNCDNALKHSTTVII
jgi:hypothetical protein